MRNSSRRCGPVLLAFTVAAASACLPSQQRDRDFMTSAELERVGERDTVFIRRVRMFEQIAARIPTDSLARLYTGALTVSADSAWVFQHAIVCQMERMVREYGAVASFKAIKSVEDSIFPPPDGRKRWADATARFPGSLGPGFKCDLTGVPFAPDSLNLRPRPRY